MALRPCPPQRIRFQLLAGIRRRAVDAGALDRVPAVGVSGGAVLPVAGSHRQDKALEQLNAKIAQLNDLLSLEKLGKLNLDDQISQLRAGLASAEGERDRIKGLYDGLAGAGSDAQGRANELNKALDSERAARRRALAQIEVLNQQISALRRQLAGAGGRRSTLPRSATRNRRAASPISASGSTSRWRSGCRNCRATVRNSSAACAPFSATGPTSASSATVLCSSPRCFSTPARRCCCPKAAPSSDKLATALIDLDKQIPSEIAWVLRVDGHTDVRPINSPLFKSNWELSSARAISVVQYLVSLGVPAQRLVAAGFAEFQPLDTAPTEEAYKRNRRIELKLTER